MKTDDSAARLVLNVVIPTRNRAAWLSKCLESLAAQTLPSSQFDITVVDDSSDTDMRGVVAAATGVAKNVYCVRVERAGGPAAARNVGWRRTRGDAVVFLDDDVVVRPTHLADVQSKLLELGRSTAAVEGRVAPLWNGREDTDSPFLQTLRTEGGGHSCNIVYWRHVLERVNGFDEGFPSAVGEDYDLAYRVIESVGPIHYDPELLVHHAVHGERSIRGLLRVHAQHRPSWLRLFVKHPAAFPPRFLPERIHGMFQRVISRPTPGRFVAFLLVRELVTLRTFRSLAMQRPRLYARWCLFVLLNSLAIVGSWSLLRRHWRQMRGSI